MENNTRIKFVQGEPYCRFDDILLTPENCKKLYGYEEELDMLSDDMIIIDNTIYSNLKLGDIISRLGEIHGEVEEYDEIASEGRGFYAHCRDKQLENTVVISLEYIKYLDNLKPYEDFKKDYPDFDVEKYKEVYNELDNYYWLLQNGAIKHDCVFQK